MVSQLLYHLPPTEAYRVIFMRRNLDEVLASQEKMLMRRTRGVPRAQMAEAFELHLTAALPLAGQSRTWPCWRSTITNLGP